MLQKPKMRVSLMGHLTRMQTLPLPSHCIKDSVKYFIRKSSEVRSKRNLMWRAKRPVVVVFLTGPTKSDDCI